MANWFGIFTIFLCGSVLAFSQAPTLTSISPTALSPGMQATVTGTGFGATQNGSVQMQGSVASIVSWSDTQIIVTVSQGTIPGHVYVDRNGSSSNQLSYTMIPSVLSSISPTSLSPGMQATLTGSGFGATKGTLGGVQLQGSGNAPIVSWSDTQIIVTVPAGTIPGHAYVYQNGVSSNQLSFTMIPAIISSISPTSLSPGMQVTFTGSGFGTTQGSGFVGLQNQNSVPIVSWSDTQIVVTVPAGTIPGHAYVHQNGVYSNQLSFTMIPAVISSISPTSLSPGMQVTFTGSGFGTTQGSGSVGLQNQNNVPIVSWSDTQIVVTVPAGTIPGHAYVYQNGVSSNQLSFTMIPAVISSISPTSLSPGMQVTFTGSGFGTTQGSGSVGLQNQNNVPIVSWSDTQIVVTVPQATTAGHAYVYQNGVSSNQVAFTMLSAPHINTLTPNSGQVGTSITIAGNNFGSTQTNSTVAFNGAVATPTNWSMTSITIPVPTGATTGNVIVTVGTIASNGLTFTVQPTVFLPSSGQMGYSRYGQTATRLNNGQVLIVGGVSTSGVVNTAELYSPTISTFTAANSLNVSRWLHTATLLNDGTVLIVGGSSLSNETTLNTAEIYDPVAGTFTLLPSTLNTARVGHTATLLGDGQVLIVGGYDPTTGIIADAELYDPTAQVFIDLGDTTTPRFHHAATLLQNGQVLITGGETDPTPGGAYNTAELFNPANWNFTSISASMISGREGHSATLLNDGTVLIAGGDTPGTGSLNTAELYMPSSNTFSAISATMASPRILHGANLLNGGKVLLSAGENDSGGSSVALNSAELYDPMAQTFTAVSANMTSVRMHQTSTLLNDGTVLEDGGSDGTNALNSAEIYVPSKLNGLASISISPASPSISLGSQQQLTATGTFNGGATQVLSSVLWSSSVTTIATISNDATSSGFAAGVAQGNATVTASAAGVSGSATLTVPAPTLVSITISPQTLTMPLGTTQQFAAVGTYSDRSTQDLTSTATWNSSSLSSTTVSNAGLVTAAGLGSSTIQVTSGTQSASTTITVGTPALVSLSVTPTRGTLAVGKNQQFQAVGTYTDGSGQNVTSLVNWYAVPQTSASISSSGLATATSQGNVTVTAAYGGFTGISALTVGSANLVSIVVLPGTSSVPVGTQQQFTATGNYSDGSTQDITSSVAWTSSATASSINSTGLATGVSSGSATITATSGSVTGSAVINVQTDTVALNTSRYQHNATLLNNGSVLFAGGINCPSAGSCSYLNSAELYNPSSGSITNTGSLAAARSAPAILLGNGKVLIAGGYNCDSSGNCRSLSSAEIYDPVAGTFSSAGTMTTDRYEHTMTLLNNGQVLIAGGETCSSATSCTALNTAELYNPIAGTFTVTGNLHSARFNAGAVALSSGQVLVAGGFDGTNYPTAAELFSPTTGTFATTGSLNTPRAGATATIINNGQVMIAGGSTCGSPGCPTTTTELYAGGSFYYPTGNMNVARFDQTATLLTNGEIFFAGGFDACASTCTSDSTTELFDPLALTFTSSQALSTGRSGHTATLLSDGSVLIVGGINNGTTLSSTDSYQPASLAPQGLASMSISPPNPPVPLGTTLTLSATGYNINNQVLNNSQTALQSVIWSSSAPSIATVSNAPGSAGIVNALSAGTTTITATDGTITASTEITVTASLVSIAISPSNPTASVGSTQALALTATGIFSDGSTSNLTPDVTWASSSISVAMISVIPGSPVIVIPVSSGSTNVTATFNGISGNTSVTVNAPLAPAPPIVTGVSPTTGAAGTQVTITGSGFGATQGSGKVWLGTNLGTVVSWSDGQVVATVSTGSSTGVALIQQTTGASNSVPFTINTATITNISPNNGLTGTQVSIAGSGFGATQNNGNIWLGTVPALVSSWTDTQITATVAAGAASGNAQVLQNGVMSNVVPFTINLPQITGISPSNGSAGTVVTVTGSGFGATQGSGTVWIGGTYGSVMGWSNTQVIASVAGNAVTGIVKVQQNGTWSNAVTFTVPSNFGGGGSTDTVTLAPNVMNMPVGATQSVQALNANGQSVTGLTWTSSNTAVATLSTDDPPIITAVAPGNTTITAGSASADVTVWSGSTLPIGTVIWSNPGDGSGVSSIVPAVPSSTGVADVFATNADGAVQAITANGTTAWTAPNVSGQIIPDFQGGAVVSTGSSIYRLDGMTGQPSTWTYTSASGNYLTTPVVHTSGTIFTVDGNTVVGINPTTGSNFSVAMEAITNNGAPIGPRLVGNLIVAGDGYAYVPYEYSQGSSTETQTSSASNATSYLNVLRVGPEGDAIEIFVKKWSQSSGSISTGSGYIPYLTPYSEIIFGAVFNTYCATPSGCPTEVTETSFSSYSGVSGIPSLITDADQGILLSFEAVEGSQSQTTDVWCYAPGCSNEIPSELTSSTSSNNNGATNNYLATITSDGGVTLAMMNVPGQQGPVQPVLQRADGSYVGTISSTVGNFTVAFTGTGNTLWTIPNDTPQIATNGGGIVGTSGTTYDQSGNIIGQIASLPTQSWLGRAYQVGSIEQISFESIPEDLSFWSSVGGNPSKVNPVAVKLQHARVFIPYGLYKQPTYQCTVSEDGSQSCMFSEPAIRAGDSDFRQQAVEAVPPWKSVMDIRIPASGNATFSNYLTSATATGPVHYPATDEIVAYIGHGIGQPDSPKNGSFVSISMGLVFPANQCLWFYNLQPPPITFPLGAPWVFPCQNDAVNSVTQKPRIIFLGMCGFTSQMLNDWTVNASTQAIIYPIYDSSNTANELDLALAANEFMGLIQSLVRGATVQDALSQMNTRTKTDITQHKTTLAPTERWSWTYYGNANLTFTTP